MNVDPSSFQEITSSIALSSTSWYVFVKNGVGRDLAAASPPAESTGGGAINHHEAATPHQTNKHESKSQQTKS